MQKDTLGISLIAAICFMFIVCSCRLIKQICCIILRETFSRNNHVSQNHLITHHETNLNDQSLQYHSRGLDSSIMHSIPKVQFKKSTDGQDKEGTFNNTDCAICLGEFEEGEWLRRITNCGHSFHVSCIDDWFQSHSSCPICRAQAYDCSMHHNHVISVQNLSETLREDTVRERAEHYQTMRSVILQNSAIGLSSNLI